MVELDLVCRCGRPLSRVELEKCSDKCPHCGNLIPAAVWENYRRRTAGENDMIDAIHEILAQDKPLFSGAR